MIDTTFDVIVIGAGPGGYIAAIRAAQLGLRVAVVERKHLGGVCANWGCIPTKAMLHGADVGHSIQTASTVGFTTGPVSFDIDALVQYSRGVVSRLTGGIEMLLEKNGIEIVMGQATIPRKGVVSVTPVDADGAPRSDADAVEYHSSHIIVATGARPRSLPGMTFDGDRVWTSTDALRPSELPSSLLIVGSGAIGSEFASLYNDLGTNVTLVEAVDTILPVEDAEISAFVRKQFERRGIAVHTSTRIQSVTPDADGVTTVMTTSTGEALTVRTDRVLVAAGIVPNTEGLGLEALGVNFSRGFIATDEWCATNVWGIYAIGDVSGPPCLAHKASHEGVLCVEKFAGLPDVHPLDTAFVPGCTYTRPQVASVGFTEAQALASNRPISIGKFDLAANGKALALGEPSGFVKTIFDDISGELLGAHMVGPEVTEMIQGFDIAHSLNATPEQLAHVIFAHPSVSEAMHESVLDSLGYSLNQLPRVAPRYAKV